MRIVNEYHKRWLINERLVQFSTSLPRIVHERVPLAYVIFLAYHTLYELSQKVNKI